MGKGTFTERIAMISQSNWKERTIVNVDGNSILAIFQCGHIRESLF